MTMGLTGLGVAAGRSLVGDGARQELVSDLIYPVGFIAVLVGRARQFAMFWAAHLGPRVAKFAHCIVTSAEILSLVVSGGMPWTAYLGWLFPVTFGNRVGGVFIVSLLNRGQVRETI
jgi:formate/nitrite transporter FocA (FNT family)